MFVGHSLSESLLVESLSCSRARHVCSTTESNFLVSAAESSSAHNPDRAVLCSIDLKAIGCLCLFDVDCQNPVGARQALRACQLRSQRSQ